MPAMNQKNMMISQAAVDLGIASGTNLAEQMSAKQDEIRKKKQQAQASSPWSLASMQLLNPQFGTGGANGGQ